MKITEFISRLKVQVIDKSVNFYNYLKPRLVQTGARLAHYTRFIWAMLQRLWARSVALLYRAQNIISGWIIRLRTLYASSKEYRSYVFISVIGLALTLVLVLTFWLGKPGDEGEQAKATDSSETHLLESVEPATDAESEQFPADIFSEEVLGDRSDENVFEPAPGQNEEQTSTTEAQGPARSDSAEAANTSKKPPQAVVPDAAFLERERVRQAALEELRKNYKAMSAEIERLRKQETRRQERNLQNKRLLEEYEAEMRKLRKQLEKHKSK